MADCVACCCAECGKGVKSIRCELQSCMPTTKKEAPLWMKGLICALNVFLTPFCLIFHVRSSLASGAALICSVAGGAHLHPAVHLL